MILMLIGNYHVDKGGIVVAAIDIYKELVILGVHPSTLLRLAIYKGN